MLHAYSVYSVGSVTGRELDFCNIAFGFIHRVENLYAMINRVLDAEFGGYLACC